jgi:hypothetical protein
VALEDECMQLALTVWGEVPGSLTEEKGEMAGLAGRHRPRQKSKEGHT